MENVKTETLIITMITTYPGFANTVEKFPGFESVT
jgi:hypothetical protein